MSAVDVAIVGGGPAGAATACFLAAAGREVVLLERSGRPHHKVCGEFLSPDTVAALSRLRIDPELLGAVAIERVAITTGRRTGAITLPFRALSLSRQRLDQSIIERAVEAGALLRRGVAVQAAEPMTKGWRLRCSDGTELRCRGLVLATGKRPLRGLADRRDGSMVGLKMHVRLAPENRRALTGSVELFLLEQGYVGLELVEDGIANLCLIMPATVAAHVGCGWQALREHLVKTAPRLGDWLAGSAALLEKPLAVVCPAGGHLPQASAAVRSGAYPVGDRLAHMPPFAGDGLAIALGSAGLAAAHIRRASSPQAYLDEARRLAAPAIRLAAAVSRLSRSRTGRIAAAQAAAHAPTLLRAIARRTRVTRLAPVDIAARG